MFTINKKSHEWRNAVIILVYKKGDKRNSKNYRGIRLNTSYKIYAVFLNFKLQLFSEKKS